MADIQKYSIMAKRTDLTKEIEFYSKTTDFILPMLGNHISIYSKYLYNVYLHPEFEDCICVVFNQNNDEELMNKLESTDGYIDDIEVKNKQIYIFKLPDEFLPNLKLFKLGKYSKFDKKYKEVILLNNIPNKIDFEINDCILYGILYHKDKMKAYWEEKLDAKLPYDAEYWSVPNLNEETLFLKELKLKVDGSY